MFTEHTKHQSYCGDTCDYSEQENVGLHQSWLVGQEICTIYNFFKGKNFRETRTFIKHALTCISLQEQVLLQADCYVNYQQRSLNHLSEGFI